MTVDITGALWKTISQSYDDLKSALKLGLKDVLGSITYAFKLTFTYNEEKLEELIKNRRIVLDNIASEYQRQWQKFSAELGPGFSTMTFLIAPGPYLAAYISSNSRADLGHVVSLLKDAGVPTRTISELFDLSGVDPKKKGEDDDDIDRSGLATLLTRDTSGMQRSELERLLREINARLAAAYEITSSEASRGAPSASSRRSPRRTPSSPSSTPSSRPMPEGVELIRTMLKNDGKRPVNESVYTDFRTNFVKGLNEKSQDFSKLLKIDSQKILNAKVQQFKEYQSVQDSAKIFVEMMESAETLEDIKKAYEFLKKVPFEIEGLDGDPMERVNKVVNANYNRIKNDKEGLRKLIDAAGIHTKETSGSEGEIKEDDAKKAILKIQIVKEIENIKNALKSGKLEESIKKIEEKLNEDFLKDLDLKTIRSMSQENILSKLISQVKKEK